MCEGCELRDCEDIKGEEGKDEDGYEKEGVESDCESIEYFLVHCGGW